MNEANSINSVFLKKILRRKIGIQSLEPLLFHFLRNDPKWGRLPKVLRTEITKEAKHQALIEEYKFLEIKNILEALATADVPGLILKGTALAYLIYAKPSLRPRCDTDILISPSHKEDVENVMTKLGYKEINAVEGELISYQISYSKEDQLGIQHTFDFHWKLSNPQVFSKLFTFDELQNQSINIPNLGPKARGLGLPHALAVACIHRVAHHLDSENLLWLYDIHLICNEKNKRWFSEFSKLAIEKKIGTICARGLSLSQDWFGTRLPEGFIAALKPQCGEADEFSAIYLNSKRRLFHDLLYDLQNLGDWRESLLLLKEHIFPKPEYMLKKYSTTRRILLPGLYVSRFLNGLWKAIKKA